MKCFLDEVVQKMDFVSFEPWVHLFRFFAGKADGGNERNGEGVIRQKRAISRLRLHQYGSDVYYQSFQRVINTVRTIADYIKILFAAVPESVVDDWRV